MLMTVAALALATFIQATKIKIILIVSQAGAATFDVVFGFKGSFSLAKYTAQNCIRMTVAALV
jgi:hypothetical protein